jgi:hypothetical protein
MLAQAVVRHVLASPTIYESLPVCRISADDQAALAAFIQRYPVTYAAEEKLLLSGSLFGLIRSQGRLRFQGYQGLAELADFDQEGLRLVWEFVRFFDPRRAHAISTPLYLRLLKGFYDLAGRLERHVALSGDMHRSMRNVSWRVHNAEIQHGRPLDDREWQAIVEDVAQRRVRLETARAYRRFLRGGRYLSELTEEQLDDAAARAAVAPATVSIIPIAEDEALEILTRDEVVEALSRLSKRQHERIAELIGLDGFEPRRYGRDCQASWGVASGRPPGRRSWLTHAAKLSTSRRVGSDANGASVTTPPRKLPGGLIYGRTDLRRPPPRNRGMADRAEHVSAG